MLNSTFSDGALGAFRSRLEIVMHAKGSGLGNWNDDERIILFGEAFGRSIEYQ
jgi:hypothetical protein